MLHRWDLTGLAHRKLTMARAVQPNLQEPLFFIKLTFEEEEDYPMLVIISDLHLTDGTSGQTIKEIDTYGAV